MKLAVVSAAGNTFAIVDARVETLPCAAQELATAVCARGALLRESGLDGLLLVAAPRNGGDCRMEIYNADGSRAEACGNGMRSVARFARERGFLARDTVRVETDCGLREVELVRDGERIVGGRAQMGVPRVLERNAALETSLGRQSATLVDIGNPHCVLFVSDERTAPVRELGAELERHPRFPKRTNVEFVALRDEQLWVRVWERGVGETQACGTGACAGAIAASLERGTALPVEVVLPGGRLGVAWDGAGDVLLSGPCEELGRFEWMPRTNAKAVRR